MRAANKRCLFKASRTLPLSPTTGSKTTIVPTSDLFVLTFRPVHRVSRIFSTSSDNNYVESECGSRSRSPNNTQRFNFKSEFFKLSQFRYIAYIFLSPTKRNVNVSLRFDRYRVKSFHRRHFVKNLKKISMFFL